MPDNLDKILNLSNSPAAFMGFILWISNLARIEIRLHLLTVSFMSFETEKNSVLQNRVGEHTGCLLLDFIRYFLTWQERQGPLRNNTDSYLCFLRGISLVTLGKFSLPSECVSSFVQEITPEPHIYNGDSTRMCMQNMQSSIY